MLSILSKVKNLKTHLIVGSSVALVIWGMYNYTSHLNNKIDALITDRATLSQIVSTYEKTTKRLEDTINENNKLLIGEISYLNKTFVKYEDMLIDNRRSVDDLSKYMSEIQNEQLQICFNTDLPDEFINRLFNKANPDPQ